MTTSSSTTLGHETQPNHTDISSGVRGKVIGPLKFMLYILSLTLIAVSDDIADKFTHVKKDQHDTSRNTLTVESRTDRSKNTDPNVGISRTRSEHVGRHEFRDAFEREESASRLLGRLFKGMGLLILAIVLRIFFSRKAKP